jgi:hypothetical protein
LQGGITVGANPLSLSGTGTGVTGRGFSLKLLDSN